MELPLKNTLRKNRPQIVEELANDATAKSMVDLLFIQNVLTRNEKSDVLVDDRRMGRSNCNFLSSLSAQTRTRYEDTAYPMTKKRQGIFLLFNNETFNEPPVLEARSQYARDEEALVELFIFRNVTLATITKALHLFAMDDIHADSECFVVFIHSHGNQEGIYMRDGKVMSFSDIITSFQTCDMLKHKPKLFLFQAYRVGTSVSDTNTPNITLPDQLADTLVAYSTVPGFPSYRFKLGSAFIQSLIRVFSKKACREDVATMIADVNARVRERMKSLVPPIIQIVENKSTLNGKWFLNPDYVVTTNE